VTYSAVGEDCAESKSVVPLLYTLVVGVSLLLREELLFFLEKKPASEGMGGRGVQLRPQVMNDYDTSRRFCKEKEGK
jgi:hypothetical protein